MSDTAARYSALDLAQALGQPAPTPEQRGVIEAPLAPTLVVAGAGSGKTETMSARVVYLVANGFAAPQAILGLTFTRKAAGELAERIRARLSALTRRGLVHHDALEGLGRPTVATYNSYCAALVRDHGLRVGVDPQAQVLSAASRWQMMYRIAAGWTGDLDATYSLSSLVEYALQLSDELAEHSVLPGDAAQWFASSAQAIAHLAPAGARKAPPDALRSFANKAGDRISLTRLVEAYRQAKAQAGVIDFADQVSLAARIAELGTDVGEGERDRYRAVLLDEYQDTSVGQLRVLRRIFGQGHPVMAVGDPNQSIYGWRGASAGGLAGFPADFANPDGATATVLPLSVAWRNDIAILDVANEIAHPLRSGLAVKLPQLTKRPGAGQGRVCVGYFDTYQDEARAVAQHIAALWRPTGPDDQSPGRSAAVLLRTRAWFAPFADALRREGLPVHVVGLGGLVDIPEVADILAALRVVHDPGRGDALVRLVAGARCALGAADLGVLGQWARTLTRQAGGDLEVGIAEALEELPPPTYTDANGHSLSETARGRLTALAQVLEQLRTMSYLGVADLVLATERALGLDIDLLARGGPTGRVHVEALVDTAHSFVRSAAIGTPPTLGAFLDWIDASVRHDNGLEPGQVEVETDAVQVLTVHAAKGLEWDIVAVPRLCDGTLPKVSRAKDAHAVSNGWLTESAALPAPLRKDSQYLPQLDIEALGDVATAADVVAQYCRDAGDHAELEERRVAYVAVTRARSELLLTGSFWSTAAKPAPPSPFLTDIADQDCVTTLTWVDEPQPGAHNPVLEDLDVERWPRDPLGERREIVERGAAWVKDADLGDLSDEDERAVQAHVLLRERDAREREGDMELPAHLSASALIRLARDRDQFAADLRRPMPTQPQRAARQGTLFHKWVESYLGVSTLFDPEDDDLGVDDLEVVTHQEVAALREAFLASRWALGEGLEKLAVEEQLEVPLGPTVLRCRVDAVFRDTATGHIQIVDWKTGRPPTDEHERQLRDIQLSAYRIGYARRHGVDESLIETYYHYVGAGHSVAPLRQYTAEELAGLLAAEQ